MATSKLEKYKDLFLSEAKAHVATMNRALLVLERSPDNLQGLDEIRRASHSLKGMASTMRYDKTVALCHAIEDVLDAIKNKKLKPAKCADTLFECFDALASALKEISKGKKERDNSALVKRLQELLTSGGTEAQPAPEGASTFEMEKVQAIEVKVERLDLLMNLGEELLINQMRLEGVKEKLPDAELAASVDALRRLVTDVQYYVMNARMVPVGFVFDRFPRMVRDLAKQQKKEVDLQVSGSDIELDKTVVEVLGESLVHLLRNAVDHGIETPEERTKAGKPPRGTITLAAKRTKGLAVVEVSDDGVGLDLEAVRNAAVARGVLPAGATHEEVLDSIFAGVSTTQEVTAVSGRGLGLHIARTKAESLGGAVRATSEPGKGTTFVMEIPLTLAVIKALFVEVGGVSYAVPLASIDRVIRVDANDIKGMLDYEATVVDEEALPIARLDVLFHAPRSALPKQPIVIVRRGEERLGLAVDAVADTRQILIKPLGKLAKENRHFAASTVIGSGEVVLVLDVANLVLSRKTQKPEAA